MAACVLRDLNCLLHLGLSSTVNAPGGTPLTVTDQATLAGSYATYFPSLTTALNQTFPVGNNPWCNQVRAPTAVQLAIQWHGLPLQFLTHDEEAHFPYIKGGILNDKGSPVRSARYLNPSSDSQETKEATSLVVTVDTLHVSTLSSGVVILLQNHTVKLAFFTSRTSSVRTAGDTDTLISNARQPTRGARCVPFMILMGSPLPESTMPQGWQC